jgi:hypothetical protein
MDSLVQNSPAGLTPPNFTAKDDFDLTYDLKILDSAKANKIFYPFGMQFDGIVNGKMTIQTVSLYRFTKLDVKNFIYQDTAIFLKDFNSVISILKIIIP